MTKAIDRVFHQFDKDCMDTYRTRHGLSNTQITSQLEKNLADAKAQLLQLILDEVIGADKQPNDNHIDKEWGDGYSCVVCEKDYRQNQLRAEQRQAARKLFGMEEK